MPEELDHARSIPLGMELRCKLWLMEGYLDGRGSEERGRRRSEDEPRVSCAPTNNNESSYASIQDPAIRSRIKLTVGIATVRWIDEDRSDRIANSKRVEQTAASRA